MKSFALKIRQFMVSEDGPTAVEYAVMLALIVIVCLSCHYHVGHERQNDVHQHRRVDRELTRIVRPVRGLPARISSLRSRGWSKNRFAARRGESGALVAEMFRR